MQVNYLTFNKTMKKVLYLSMMILAMAFTSCSKEEPGGTATQKVAGEWYVTVSAVYTDGTEDDWTDAPCLMTTMNTAANDASKMYLTDINYFDYGVPYAGYYGYWNVWGIYVPVTVDQSTGAFQTEGTVNSLAQNYYYSYYGYDQYASVTVYNGKISYNGGKQNNGSVADAIEFDIKVKNDYTDACYAETESGYYAESAIDHFHVSGVRYSGLTEND